MISHRLKLARAAAGLSLHEVSTGLGGRVSAEAIDQYEQNERMPASDVLIALARVLGVTEEFLLRNFDEDGQSARARAQMNILDLVGRCLMAADILGTPAERIEQALSRWLESLCYRALSEGAIFNAPSPERHGFDERLPPSRAAARGAEALCFEPTSATRRHISRPPTRRGRRST